jgi:hypothetical protein
MHDNRVPQDNIFATPSVAYMYLPMNLAEQACIQKRCDASALSLHCIRTLYARCHTFFDVWTVIVECSVINART